MIQKAILAGFIAALSILLVINLAVHESEAFFMVGWVAAKMGNFEKAAATFERGLGSAAKNTPVRERLSIADGAALTASGFNKEAIGSLSNETTATEGKEKLALESLRLYDLGNARAKDALTLEGENRKMQFFGALSAYTGAYRINGDQDAAFNYEVVKKYLEEEKAKEEEKKQEEKNKTDSGSQDSGWDSRKTDQGNEGGSQSADQGKKAPENKDGSAKWAGDQQKTGNWTNAGSPATLKNDPGGSRGSNGSVPLSTEERKELENDLGSLSDLQKDRDKYLRQDGQQGQIQGGIPNSLRQLFSGDPFFDRMVPQADTWPNGKSW